jgi:hypothetical protein
MLLRGGIEASRDQNGAAKCGRKRKRNPIFPEHGTAPENIPRTSMTTRGCAKRSAKERCSSFQKKSLQGRACR